MITKEYKYGEDILSILEETIYDATNGKITDATLPEGTMVVDTGIGGLFLVERQMKKLPEQESAKLLPVNNPAGDTIRCIPTIPKIWFRLNVSQDIIEAHPDTNPMIVGWTRSSLGYTLIWDGVKVAQIICTGKQDTDN